MNQPSKRRCLHPRMAPAQVETADGDNKMKVEDESFSLLPESGIPAEREQLVEYNVVDLVDLKSIAMDMKEHELMKGVQDNWLKRSYQPSDPTLPKWHKHMMDGEQRWSVDVGPNPGNVSKWLQRIRLRSREKTAAENVPLADIKFLAEGILTLPENYTAKRSTSVVHTPREEILVDAIRHFGIRAKALKNCLDAVGTTADNFEERTSKKIWCAEKETLLVRQMRCNL